MFLYLSFGLLGRHNDQATDQADCRTFTAVRSCLSRECGLFKTMHCPQRLATNREATVTHSHGLKGLHKTSGTR